MENKSHLPTLDFLRGAAAMSVLLFHFSGTGLRKLTVEANEQLFSWGHYGVEVFFVISGFIIPYVLSRSNYRLRDFGHFLGKRFVRISGPAYVLLGLMVVLYFFIDHLHLSENAWFAGLSTPQILHNLAFTVPFSGYQWVNPVFWTLSVEFQYYLVLGLAYPFVFRSLRNFIFSAVVAGSMYYTPIAQQAEFFAYNSLFVMGGISFLLFDKRITLRQFAVLLLAAAVVCFFQQNLLSALFGLAASLLICFARIRNRWSDFFGRISYSLYLTHIPIGLVAEGVFVKLFPAATVPVRLGLFVAAVLLGIAGAYFFNRLVEVHFQALSNRLFRKALPRAPKSRAEVVRAEVGKEVSASVE